MQQLLACGSNGAGQLAIGHVEDVSLLTPCVFDPSCPASLTVLDLVSASAHVLAIARDDGLGRNVLLGAGTNTHGQLGLACALTDTARPATSFRPLSIARDAGLDDDAWEPVKIAATWTTSIIVFSRRSVASGPSFSSSSSSFCSSPWASGQVIVTAGSNDFGELGVVRSDRAGAHVLGDVLDSDEWVEHIKGGQRHVVAIVSRGHGPRRTQRVCGWGSARRGELEPSPSPRGKARAKSAAATPSTPRTLTPTTISLPLEEHVTGLALGATHSVVLLESGRVFAWGNDLKGQITGLTTTADLAGVRDIAATWGGTYLVDDDGAVWSQGSNTHCQLLRVTDSPTRGAVPLAASVKAISVVAGSEHVLVLVRSQDGDNVKSNADIQLWTGGWNEHGNLGLGDAMDRAELMPVQIPSLNGTSLSRVWGGCAATWVQCQ